MKTIIKDGEYVVIQFRCRTCGCIFRCGIADCHTEIVMVNLAGDNFVRCETKCPNCNVDCEEAYIRSAANDNTAST
jgi:hypothetical protein